MGRLKETLREEEHISEKREKCRLQRKEKSGKLRRGDGEKRF